MPDVPTPNLKVHSFPGVLPKPARVRPKPPRGQSAASLKRKATEAHSRYVRARDGRCMRCGKLTARMECMHVFSRRYAATRTTEENGHTGCSGCHMYLTQNPLEHVQFFRALLGDQLFFTLRDTAYYGKDRKYPADFWRGELSRLEAKLAALGDTDRSPQP